MRNFKLLVLLGLITFNSSFAVVIETDSMETIKKTAMEKAKKYGPKEVLVVFDIDNTTLAMPQSLGSDQWFGWQYSHCIGKKKAPEFCVTNDFNELLDIQGKLFALSDMVPTETATPVVIKELQDMGHSFILLTSRSSEFRNATERALKMNGIDTKRTPIGSPQGYPSTYIPYELSSPQKSGLSKEDIKKMGTKKARPVSYMNGVFMTAGLNKGIMLKTLLHKTGKSFKAVIFADDHKKHTTSMESIIGADKSIDLTAFRYSKIDPEVQAFHKSDKKDVTKAWNKINGAMQAVFK